MARDAWAAVAMISLALCSWGCTSSDDDGKSGTGGQGGSAGDAATPTIQDWLGLWNLKWKVTSSCTDAATDLFDLDVNLQRVTISAGDGSDGVHMLYDPVGGAESDGTVDSSGTLHAKAFTFPSKSPGIDVTISTYDAALVMAGAVYNFDTPVKVGSTGGCTSDYSLHGQP